MLACVYDNFYFVMFLYDYMLSLEVDLYYIGAASLHMHLKSSLIRLLCTHFNVIYEN